MSANITMSTVKVASDFDRYFETDWVEDCPFCHNKYLELHNGGNVYLQCEAC